MLNLDKPGGSRTTEVDVSLKSCTKTNPVTSVFVRFPFSSTIVVPKRLFFKYRNSKNHVKISEVLFTSDVFYAYHLTVDTILAWFLKNILYFVRVIVVIGFGSYLKNRKIMKAFPKNLLMDSLCH